MGQGRASPYDSGKFPPIPCPFLHCRAAGGRKFWESKGLGGERRFGGGGPKNEDIFREIFSGKWGWGQQETDAGSGIQRPIRLFDALSDTDGAMEGSP